MTPFQKLSAVICGATSGSSGLIRSSAWNLSMRLCGMGASLVLGILLARYLKPSEFGLYGIFVSLALILSVVGRLGFPNLATREIAVSIHRQEWTLVKGVFYWFGRTVLLLSTVTAAVFLAAALVWTDQSDDLWSGPALWTALLIPLFALSALVGAQLRGLDHLVVGQSLDSFVRPALTCILCAGAVLGWQNMNAAMALGLNVVASTLTLVLGFFLLMRWMPVPLRRVRPERHGRRWGKSSLLLGAVDGLRQVDANQGLIILGALAQTTQAGYLRVALSALVFVVLPQTVIHLVAASTLARLSAAGEGKQLQLILSRTSRNLFSVTSAFLVVLAAAGLPLIKLMFGSAYAPAWLPLLLLAAAQLVSAAFGLGWVLMTMAGGERRLGQFYAISVSAGLAAGIPLCIAFGAIGAALATLVSSLIQNLLIWRHVLAHHSVDCSMLAGFRGR